VRIHLLEECREIGMARCEVDGMGSTENDDAQAQGAHDGMADARHSGVVRLGLVVPSLDRRLHHRHVVTTVTLP
jgi:hypothetical protein